MEPMKPIRRRPGVKPLRKGERNLELEVQRAEQKEEMLRRQKEFVERRSNMNTKAAEQFVQDYNLVMDAMNKQAASPITSEDYANAVALLRQQALNAAQPYKTMSKSLLTLGELGASGTSLLGAYANWRRWANASNVFKQTMANLLQKAQFPAQVSGTVIDGIQTYDAILNNDDFETYYNGGSGILGTAGSIGASDVFLNSRFHNARVDRIFDMAGILLSAGDFVKFGYDQLKQKLTLTNDKK